MKKTPKKHTYLLKILQPLFQLLRVINLQVWPRNVIAPNSIDIVQANALASSAKYIEENMSKALLFQDRKDFWRYSLSKVTVDGGLFCEFGVSHGKSMSYFCSVLDQHQTIHGFDSFEGLKEDFYGTAFKVGSFTTESIIPKFPANVQLHVGWFEDTLPHFLESHEGQIGFLHIDCDTYESTAFVLESLRDRILPETIVVFDEYQGIPNWQNGERLAWKNFLSSNKKNIGYEYIAFAPQGAAIKIVRP